MSEVTKALQERRGRVWEQAKALADTAADENRNFSGEEEASWQTLNAELDALDKRIKAVVDGEQRAKDAEDAMTKLRGEPRQQAGGPGSVDVDELRAFLRGDTSARSFAIAATPVARRDLSSTTGSAGGNTVPTSFYGQLVEHMTESAAILQSGATVLNTAGGETLQIPKTTAHTTAAIQTQGSTFTEADPTFGLVELGAYKYGRLVQVPRELVDDTGVDLEGYLAKSAGRALGDAFGAHAIVGTGSGQPRGVVLDASAGKTGPAAVGGGFGTQSTVGQGGDLLIDLFHSVIAPYRRSAACNWMMNDQTAAAVRKIKTTEGNYIWQPSLIVGQPDTIMGKPVLIDPNVADIAVAAESILFGDFSAYFVRLAGGIAFERSDDFAFGADMITFRARMRADGALVDLTGAIKSFTGGASS